MGRIAYLSKRGRVWWFRRRYPALFVTRSQSHQNSTLSEEKVSRAQAQGHLAVSLKTSSPREARLLGARLCDHFERAWAAAEGRITTMKDDQTIDFLDSMTHLLTEGFRNYVKHYRETQVSGMSPVLRERAFAVLDAELRDALGIAPLPFDDIFKRTTPSRVSVVVQDRVGADTPLTPAEEAEQKLYDEMADDPLWALPMSGEDEDDTASTRAEAVPVMAQAVAARIDPARNRLIDPDDPNAIEHLEAMADGLGRLLDSYVQTCEREGLDPAEELPSARQIAQDLHRAALRLGLPAAKAARGAAEAKHKRSSERFSAFAQTYLKLRCQGYTLRREDEASHAKTGEAFERTSLRNWLSSVRVFTDIVGDMPLCEITKHDIIEFNEHIQRLPANFGKSSRDQRNARQVIEDADEEDAQKLADLTRQLAENGTPPNEIDDIIAEAMTKRISATTVKRHQTALQSILEHAARQHLIESNPFKGRVLTEGEVKKRKKSERRVERVGWGDNIYALFDTKIFRNPLDDAGDPLFWAPLIAVYAGLRMEEICQLRVRDFGKEDGILHLAVQNEVATQLVKSDAGFRKIPLHRALIDLGLPQLVDMRKQQGMSRLFPNVPRSKSKGTLSAIMSKRFG